ncbi:MAG: NERD domain-containing protein [Lachnospiraceae bacterium]|nr:NERD domain-containing protein [Lachnospiraceae bacterium]MCM1229547.1 NERD domain-containing protein [Ruminococcus flavefaciens]
MGLFSSLLNKNNLDKPVILKDISDNGQIEKLENLLLQKEYSDYEQQIKEDIFKIKSGYYGENQVKYYLKNSGMPMYILHDLYFEYDNETKSQIDFLVITRKMIFIIECKNFSFSSQITVDENEQFIITQKDNTKQSIKNPIEQNRIHTELLSRMFPKIKKAFFPLVVFANENSILDYSNAPDEIKNHIVRADNLVSHIKKLNKNSRLSELSDSKMKDYVNLFLEKNKKNPIDYTLKYQRLIPAKPPVEIKESDVNIPKQEIKCICPNCSQPVPKGYYYCKCGMQFTIYGIKLSDENINLLISGKSVQCDTQYGLRIIYPQTESRDYQGKTYIHWKSSPASYNK